MIRVYKDTTLIVPASLFLYLETSEPSCHAGKFHLAKNWGTVLINRKLGNSLWQTEFDHKPMRLEADLSPAKVSVEIKDLSSLWMWLVIGLRAESLAKPCLYSFLMEVTREQMQVLLTCLVFGDFQCSNR